MVFTQLNKCFNRVTYYFFTLSRISIPEAISDLLLSGPWLPAVGEHLAASKWPQMVPQICEFLGLEKKLPISGDENVKVKIYD